MYRIREAQRDLVSEIFFHEANLSLDSRCTLRRVISQLHLIGAAWMNALNPLLISGYFSHFMLILTISNHVRHLMEGHPQTYRWNH